MTDQEFEDLGEDDVGSAAGGLGGCSLWINGGSSGQTSNFAIAELILVCYFVASWIILFENASAVSGFSTKTLISGFPTTFGNVDLYRDCTIYVFWHVELNMDPTVHIFWYTEPCGRVN